MSGQPYGAGSPRPPGTSGSAATTTASHASHASRARTPRSLPPWIDSYEVRYGLPEGEDLRRVSQPPPKAVAPQHDNTAELQRRVSRDGYVDPFGDTPLAEAKRSKHVLPTILHARKGGAERGRKWDHLRSADPVIVSGYKARVQPSSPWHNFVLSSQYGHLPNEEAQILDPSDLDKLQPTFNNPVDVPRASEYKTSRKARTTAFYKRAWNTILKHPFVPLAFRLTVLLTSIIALALGARIFRDESRAERRLHNGPIDPGEQGASVTQAIVAIVVDCVAIPYIMYMTWDEYTGKPLGLRSASNKISLVLLDLFFIIFKSVSTTLAFEALRFHRSNIPQVRHYSEALAAFQTVGLIAWSMTFAVNVFRLVQRLGGNEEVRYMWGGHG